MKSLSSLRNILLSGAISRVDKSMTKYFKIPERGLDLLRVCFVGLIIIKAPTIRLIIFPYKYLFEKINLITYNLTKYR